MFRLSFFCLHFLSQSFRLWVKESRPFLSSSLFFSQFSRSNWSESADMFFFFFSLHLFSRVSSYFLVQWWCSLLCSVIALVKFASLALWLSETCRILIWKALMYLFFTGLLDDFHQDLISIGHWMENVIYRVSI